MQTICTLARNRRAPLQRRCKNGIDNAVAFANLVTQPHRSERSLQVARYGAHAHTLPINYRNGISRRTAHIGGSVSGDKCRTSHRSGMSTSIRCSKMHNSPTADTPCAGSRNQDTPRARAKWHLEQTRLNYGVANRSHNARADCVDHVVVRVTCKHTCLKWLSVWDNVRHRTLNCRRGTGYV